MWLVEKDPDTTDDYLYPINSTHVMTFISEDDDEDFVIKFEMVGGEWYKWWFKKEEDRDRYIDKLLFVLPRLKLGVDDISL